MSVPASLAMSVLLGLTAPQQTSPQSTPVEQAPPVEGQATAVDDVLVESGSIRSTVRSFVGTVAAPARLRGAARWTGALCVGVVNLQNDAAQFLNDRVSAVGAEMGLQTGEPGCKPNLVVMMTTDGDALARGLVRSRRNEFMVGTSGATAGRQALEAFQSSAAPVRWWHVSIPVNGDTGQAAVRLPHQPPFSFRGAITKPSDVEPYGITGIPSRLNSQIEDRLQQVLVIVDIDRTGGASFEQLADYVAMVGLAQIDPEADTGAFDTILNLFEGGAAAAPGLTRFDLAYLHGLYDAEQRSASMATRASEVAVGMERDLRREP